MKNILQILLIFIVSLNAISAQEKGVSLVLPQIQVIPIKDNQANRQYELYVKLPEGYSENDSIQYPVVYTTDAMWHMEMLSASTEYIIEDIVLVGISWQKDVDKDLLKEAGAHVSRYRDYSIRESSNSEHQAKYQFGQARNHLDFIHNDVFKYIENNYRTDSDNRTYFGYSLGGEFGAYILLAQPDTFKNYILGSPSLKGEIPILSELDSQTALRHKDLRANVFISYGSLEKELGEHAEEFISILKNSKNENLSLHHVVIEGSHQTVFPMTAVRAVTWLQINNLTTLESPNLGQKPPEATDAKGKLSFRDIPNLKEAFIDAAPRDRKDGISVGELGIDGGNKAMILKLAQEISDNKYGNFDSFLIAHKGKLIFESYYSRGRVDLPHPQASATKAYTSFALGRAIQMGYLSMADLDRPLISFLKDMDPTKMVEGVEKITLHQALTMRSGIRISKEQREELEKNPSKLKGQGKVQAYLEHSAPITSVSQRFKYQFDPMLVMQVIDAVVPGSAEDFIKSELLGKMGITTYDWGTDLSGLPKAGSRSSMTSRDMVKWGTLAITKGKWQGEQLVPEAFIAIATSKIVDQSDEYDDLANGVSGTAYGYFWWQADLSIGDKSYLSRAARGGSGQNIIVIEELDLIVVTTTHRPVDDTVAVTATRVLPAFIK